MAAVATIAAAVASCTSADPSAPSIVAAGGGACTLANDNEVATGYDALGYNRCAGVFNGAADGTDGILDGKLWGGTAYAADRLLMKWNRAWDLCNDVRTPDNCAGAWLSNEWNGQVTGGSGETWHYKFKWVGNCDATPSLVPDGGYCIWGEYAVILSQGTAGQHFWDAHANPAGFGN
jgi:hypothetical protein